MAHPLFPAIVALWFAALFGLGSLAIRPALIEGVVLAIRLNALVPAAAPPLGLTARLLIAVGLAVLGAGIGAVLARRLAASATAPVARRTPRRAPAEETQADEDAMPRRAFVARPAPDQVGEDIHDLPATPAFPGRRRALAIHDEGQPDIHDFVPLPGGGAPQILDISAFTLDEGDQAALAMQGAAQPPLARPAQADIAPQADAFDDGWIADVPDHDDAGLIRARVAPLPEVAPDDALPATADLLPPRRGGVFALAETAPPLFADSAAPSVPDQEPAPAAVAAPPRFTLPTGTAAERIAGADLDALSHVELIERLALSLQRRRNAEAARQAAASAAALADTHAVAATADEPAPLPRIGRLMAEPAMDVVPEDVAARPVIPAAFRPISLDALVDEDEDGDAMAHVPLRSIALPARDAAWQDDDGGAPREIADTDEDDDGYGSLVEMTVAATLPRTPLIRIEEPEEPADAIEPVVIFPGHNAGRIAAATSPFGEAPVLRQFDPPGPAGLPGAAPAPAAALNDPDEAERALRSALATLQRMNGAA